MNNEMMPSGSGEQPEQIPLDFESESVENKETDYLSPEKILVFMKEDNEFKKIWNDEEAMKDRAFELQQIMNQMKNQKEFAHLLQNPSVMYFIAKKSEKVTPEEQAEKDRFDPYLNR
jgi:hypothetical protein